MRAVWPEQFVEEGNLNKNVSRRRHAARIPYGCPKRDVTVEGHVLVIV